MGLWSMKGVVSNTPFSRQCLITFLMVACGRLLYRYLLPLRGGRLHRHQDGAVVGDLVHGLSYNGVHDGYVPSPQLVKMVALSVGCRTLSECRSESSFHQLLLDLGHLPV